MAAHNDLAFVISANGRGAAGDQRRSRAGHRRHDVVVRRAARQLRAPDDGPGLSDAATVRRGESRRPAQRAALAAALLAALRLRRRPRRPLPPAATASRRPRWPRRWPRPQDSWAVVPMSRPTRPSGRSSSGRRARRPGSSSRRPASRTTAGSSPAAHAAARSPSRSGPSQELAFSPLATTANGGASWSTGGLIDAAVAARPDALAAAGSQLVALLGDGTIETSSDAGTTWSALAGPGAIAGSPAGRGCGARRVTVGLVRDKGGARCSLAADVRYQRAPPCSLTPPAAGSGSACRSPGSWCG